MSMSCFIDQPEPAWNAGFAAALAGDGRNAVERDPMVAGRMTAFWRGGWDTANGHTPRPGEPIARHVAAKGE